MKLKIKLERIDYGDVAVRALPMLASAMEKRENTASKTLAALSKVPPYMIYDTFEAIPAAEKNEILASFAVEYRERLVDLMNNLSNTQGFGVKISDFTMDRDLTISAVADIVDYRCIVERFLPAIRQKLLNMGGVGALLRPVIQNASADQVAGLLERFVGADKMPFVTSLINQNQNVLITRIEEGAGKQGIRLKIKSIEASV